ncbi:hypothetical protein [Ensifer soli]|uniref:hypothetical protein n=1 Tax=Ciceribacter sp. sgz301302 TaxID=3342379 RepID=UPI0035B72F2B
MRIVDMEFLHGPRLQADGRQRRRTTLPDLGMERGDAAAAEMDGRGLAARAIRSRRKCRSIPGRRRIRQPSSGWTRSAKPKPVTAEGKRFVEIERRQDG